MSTKELIRKIVLRSSVVLLPLSVGIVTVLMTLFMIWNIRIPGFALPLFSIFTGIILWYAGILFKNRARFFFGSILLVLEGILFFMLELSVFSLEITTLWPVLMLIIGFALLVSGIVGNKKAHPIFIVPSVAFILLGFLFLLFSTGIIHVSLAGWWLPLFFLPAVGVVFFLLIRNRITKK